MENIDFDFWMFIAGLGIFLFGMRHLEESIKGLAGKSFKNLLQRFTDKSWKGILTGTAVTAILQSSSMVTLLALAFLGGGMIGLKNALGVVLGANLGTTFTAWIVATFGFKMDIADFSFPFLAVGILSYLFLKTRPFLMNFGGLLIGFGLLFLGLDFMKEAIEKVAGQIDLSSFASYGLWAFLLLGLFITALIQSSSAMIVIILSALNAGLIDINQAVAMVIGANIGTTVTLIFGSIGGTADKKRLMLANVIFNCLTGLLIYFLIDQLVYLVYYILGVEDVLMQLVLINTLINVIGIVLFYPLLASFRNFLNQRFISSAPQGETLYVKNIPTNVPDVALKALDMELIQVFNYTRDFFKESFGLGKRDKNRESRWNRIFSGTSGVMNKYEKIKRLEDELTAYYAQLQEENLSRKEAELITSGMIGLRFMIYAAKDIKDVNHNILNMIESEDPLAQEVLSRLRKMVSLRLRDLDELLELDIHKENPLHWLDENEAFYNETISWLYKNIKSQDSKGVQFSTMTNVIRQTVSSLNNLCNSIIYVKFKKETAVDQVNA